MDPNAETFFSVQNALGVRAGEYALQILDFRKQPFAARQVEFAHHVVQNENGRLSRNAAENLRFGKFHCKRRRTRLTLRGITARVLPVERHTEIVAVRSYRRKPESKIALTSSRSSFSFTCSSSPA